MNSNDNKTELSDFDAIRAHKKQRRPKGHRAENVAEEEIFAILKRMQHAAVEDRELYLSGQLPTKKLALLQEFVDLLKKKHLKDMFLEHGLLRVIALWLKPLAEGYISVYEIRKTFLELLLNDYTCIRKVHLLKSELGKIILQLSKDPLETAANRVCARKLVHRWSRDVYEIKTDYRGTTSSDRLKMDMERLSEAKIAAKTNSTEQTLTRASGNNGYKSVDIEEMFSPSSKGTCLMKNDVSMRARVPMPASNVYIQRPQSQDNCQSEPLNLSKYERILDRYFINKILN